MTRKSKVIYSETELLFIQKNREMPRRSLRDLFAKKFSRDDVTIDNIKSLCTRNGWKTGRDGRFSSGQESWNKGKKMPFNPNSAKTQFKKGQLPHNTKFEGHERISPKDGYVLISIKQENPHTGFERRYVLKHKYLWENENGPVPEGHFLKCLDGNRANCKPENWECLKNGMKPRLIPGRHGRDYDNAPPEIKPLILQTAKLAQKIYEVRKEIS